MITLRRAVLIIVIVGLLGSAGAAAAAAPPRRVLLTARTQIRAAAAQSAGGANKRAAEEAATDLGRAAEPSRWLDPDELVAPAYGAEVFAFTAAALRDLRSLRGPLLAARRRWERLIATTARAVAVVPIKEARRGDQQLLSTAKRAVAEADLAANANHEVRAVEGYGVAWRRAFQTLTELVSAEATHVPAVALAAAADEALGSKKIALAGPLFPRKVTLLTAASKPELFFGGAEGCPFCAVQRWGMIVALSQFGTFSNLHLMQSDATEPPAVRTFTFFGSSYRSRYVSFVPVEILSNVRQRNRFEHLQRLTAAQRALVNRFDPQGQTPFIDVGGRFIQTDATVRPELLGAESWTEIAGRLTNPSSVSTQAIAGEAEVLTAELCTVTGGAPISVCSSSEVKEYQAGLPLLDGHGGGCPMPHPGGGLPSRTHPPRAGTTRCHI